MSGHTYSKEEEILIIDLYKRIDKRNVSKTNPLVINLCTLLNLYGYDCTVGGIAAKLSNLLSVDPEYVKDGKTGWENISSDFKTLWNYYCQTNFKCLYQDVIDAWKKVYSNNKSCQSDLALDD